MSCGSLLHGKPNRVFFIRFWFISGNKIGWMDGSVVWFSGLVYYCFFWYTSSFTSEMICARWPLVVVSSNYRASDVHDTSIVWIRAHHPFSPSIEKNNPQKITKSWWLWRHFLCLYLMEEPDHVMNLWSPVILRPLATTRVSIQTYGLLEMIIHQNPRTAGVVLLKFQPNTIAKRIHKTRAKFACLTCAHPGSTNRTADALVPLSVLGNWREV